MSILQSFQYSDYSVRTTIVDGVPWFVAKDLCGVLGISKYRDAVSRLDDDERGSVKVDTLGGKQELATVSESGMYALVLRSRKSEAQAFRKWITSEVLPSIRKTGGYSAIAQPSNTVALPQNYIEALKALVAAEEQKALLEAEKQLLEDANHGLSEALDELFDYSSIIRVAKYNNASESLFTWHRLKAVSNQMGIEVKKAPCPRFGEKNLYSHDVWRIAYPGVRLPETTTITLAPPHNP
jgi:prophage antirepressor-like protein